MSGGQVQAIVRNATPEFSEHEAEVVPALVDLSVADTALAMQQWKAMLDIEPKFRKACTYRRRWTANGNSQVVVPTALEHQVVEAGRPIVLPRHHVVGLAPLRRAVAALEPAVPVAQDEPEKLKPDGTLVITDPRGRTRTTRPPGTLISQ